MTPHDAYQLVITIGISLWIAACIREHRRRSRDADHLAQHIGEIMEGKGIEWRPQIR